MECLWFENGQVQVRGLPQPSPGRGEALLKVLLAGICGTDLQLLKGYYKFSGVPGHEFVAEVVQAPGNESWVGERVVADINIACGQCEFCRLDNPHHCVQRRAVGINGTAGAFAQYMLLPVANLYRVPDPVSNELAVFAEPLAAAVNVLNAVSLNTSDHVLVLGGGKLGLLIAQVMAASQCQFDVLARHANQKRLLSHWGYNEADEHSLQTKKYSVVIEATGSADGFESALKYIKPQGCIVLKSTYKDKLRVDLSSIVVNEIRIVGSRCGDIPQALALLEEEKVDPRPLIEATFELQRAEQAFSLAAQRGSLKVLLEPH